MGKIGKITHRVIGKYQFYETIPDTQKKKGTEIVPLGALFDCP